ncbi:MAG TPA: beta-ketoacyl-ACP synthase II [Candidatus Limnocylindria bacterium]|jgi:3-oxoacyl-[acyl-carrier-protein] synthase II|nr:beta-ketoacyl-ACP synthase II [Candidatus Limnocylindria bacterium]
MSRDPARRAVVTGLGAITPIGNDAETFWASLLAGTSGVAPISAYDASGEEVRIAAEVKGFDPATWIDFKQARRMSRFSQFAVAAAGQAIADADLEITDANRNEIGVIVNTGGGGIGDVAVGERIFLEQGGKRVSPFMVPMLSPSMAACQISIQNGLHGPVIASVAACASGVQALIDAQRLIERGDVEVVLAGGTESAILPVAFAALANMGALSKRNDDPTAASRPFDADRDGFVFGEGAAILTVESAEHAERRGARIIAEVAGGAMTGDAFHISAPDPTGEGAARAMVRALRDAGVAPDEVEYVVAHGTSTPLNDATETKAIHAAFGEHTARLAVSSNKSMVGHTLGAAGAISAVAAVCSIRDGLIPPTINYQTPDPACDLDYVPNTARQVPVRTAIINGFGFGGQNAVAVFRRYEAAG